MYQKFDPGAVPLIESASLIETVPLIESDAVPFSEIPHYLTETYWWAYIHPRAVRFFDRMLAVNLILFGNYRRLRNAALAVLPSRLTGRTLQVACVYGDFTPSVASRLAPGASLDVVDVVPIQLENLRGKLPASAPVTLYRRNSEALGFESAHYDQAIVFFLLHEQPEAVRRRTLAEVLRVLRPGGRLVVVDYHRPHWLNPLRLLMKPLLARLEPYALDLWRKDVSDWLPEGVTAGQVQKRTFFGGLYQRIVIDR